ncbi:prolyl oligopeptidase family serine peptidase [Agrobacterium tumefaciens]|uniref:carboxylesterase family protein n=1 Tax=Agrobacterium tumefaciens TaxID=358 RepID=UPI0015722A25|nr:prolyl oligopeptidase family serine peptidase [Agrobacterium tumefaciens]NTE58332.1 prolyl oligopeptidase family serine peptidase [Agrobacterium tumefaciens]NTE69335.1 prolyl oligopeptidase family serine peptidase [Agrobacterium tumefaciens]NTE69762.1 prolyl oligopeptidase family serine peptidase [Agrobacterium tumefaciens]
MKHLKFCLIAAAVLVSSTFAAAEQKAMKSDVTIASDINYLLYTPKDYSGSDKTYPLVVWLHGGDQGGSDIEKLRRSGLPKMVEEGRDFPFLVFSPQNPSEELLYPIERVAAALQSVVTEHRVDRSRIYLIGYSRGGFGAWSMAEQFPDTFAAVVPIAGGGIRHYLNRTNEKTAFWAFHGTNDAVIPLSDTVALVQRLQELKRNVRLTVFEDTDHEAVEAKVLKDEAMWAWLLEQKLAPGKTPSSP